MSETPLRLIETVRIRNGRAPLWPLHIARLERSAAALGLDIAPIEEPAGPDGVVRLLAGAEGVSVEARPLENAAPLTVVWSAVPHPQYPHKVDRREPFDRALTEARGRGAAEAILSTAEGWVAEGSFTTVFWWEGESLAAPPLALGILPSVARRRIGEIAGPLVEMRVEPGGLTGRPLFLANAARGIVEVALLQGESVPRDARTAALARRFWP